MPASWPPNFCAVHNDYKVNACVFVSHPTMGASPNLLVRSNSHGDRYEPTRDTGHSLSEFGGISCSHTPTRRESPQMGAQGGQVGYDRDGRRWWVAGVDGWEMR